MTHQSPEGAVAMSEPQHTEIIEVLRDLMTQYAPNVSETISHGGIAWKGRRILAVVSLGETHLTFTFARGAEFDDRFGLLDGVDTNTRHLKIKRVEAIDREVVGAYIRQAVELDHAAG
jgi:hypothetical protein